MPRFIPEDVLETIRMKADIVDVVESYVHLKKAGTNAWKACCPFHNEKTPSFNVNSERQIFKCFGCGTGGNVFSFIMNAEKLDFPGAVEFLARKYGIPLPEDEPQGTTRGIRFQNFPAVPEKNSYHLQERLYQLHELLAGWYRENLRNGTAAPAVSSYFATRGIPEEFAQRFLIGASPDSWDSAIRLARQKGFTDKELQLSGIVSEKEGSDHFYDRFRNRLMFPIWNQQGRVVAFSARSIEKDPGGWKYVNSPETPVFKKSRTLYALHIAKKSIPERGAILCEGQLDVIAMHRAGFDNAVAAQGTAFTPEHAKILKRFSPQLTLALDSDKAGCKAVFADAEILLPMGFELKVIRWPGGKDPDELLKTTGAEAISQAVADAVDFFEFAFNDAAKNDDAQTPRGKARIAQTLINRIALLDSESAREAYLQWLAGKLGLSPDSLRADLNSKAEAARRNELFRKRREAEQENFERDQNAETEKAVAVQPAQKPLSQRNPGIKNAYLELISLLMDNPELAGHAAHDINENLCDETATGRALEILIQSGLDGNMQDAPQKIITELMSAGLDTNDVAGIIFAHEQKSENNAGAAENTVPVQETGAERAMRENAEKQEQERKQTVYEDCIRMIRREFCHMQMERIAAEAAELSDDNPEKLELIRQTSDLAKQIAVLNKKSKLRV